MASRLLRCRRSFAGFTLIELLIVIIIVGILVAIGVPAYLKYVAAANDRDAQSALRVAYKAAVAGDSEVNTGKFPVASTVVNDVKADEPAASVTRGDCYANVLAAPVKQVLVDPSSTPSQITLCDRSASGAIWRISGPLTGTPTLSDGSVVPLAMAGNEITDAVRAAGLSGDGLTNDSSTGIYLAATNLVANGTAADTSGFSNNDGFALVSRDASVPIMGTASLRVTTQPGISGVRTTNTLVAYPTLTAGQTYTASVWAIIPPGVQAFLTVADPSNAFTAVVQTPIVGSGSLTRYMTTFTPASSGTASVMMTGRSSTGAFSFSVGAFQLEQNANNEATPYVRTTTAVATRPVGRVQLPAALASSTQGWYAARIRPDFSASTTTGFRTVASFGNTFNEAFGLTFRPSSPRWKMEASHGGVATAQGLFAGAGFTNPGDQVTVIGTWTVAGGNATVQVYVNGVAGTPQTGPAPAISGTPTFDIGSQAGGQVFDGDILWFATGTGTLSAGDVTTINSWGSSDPLRASFPSSAQATVVWDGASPNASLK